MEQAKEEVRRRKRERKCSGSFSWEENELEVMQ